jgi:hypothetical protein
MQRFGSTGTPENSGFQSPLEWELRSHFFQAGSGEPHGLSKFVAWNGRSAWFKNREDWSGGTCGTPPWCQKPCSANGFPVFWAQSPKRPQWIPGFLDSGAFVFRFWRGWETWAVGWALMQGETRTTFHQAVLKSVPSQARSLVEVEFVHEMLPVFLDRFNADPQLRGDLLVGVSFRDKLQNLRFPPGESASLSRFAGGALAPLEKLHEMGKHFWTKNRSPPVNG